MHILSDELTVEGEISDGELTDLLAEVDESASTSTRLRPSSSHRPSSSADRRHSQRLQSTAGADPPPRPRSSWVSSTSHRESNFSLYTSMRLFSKQLGLCSGGIFQVDER